MVRVGEGKGEGRRRKSGLNAPRVSFNCYLRGAITLFQGSKGGRREGQVEQSETDRRGGRGGEGEVERRERERKENGGQRTDLQC